MLDVGSQGIAKSALGPCLNDDVEPVDNVRTERT